MLLNIESKEGAHIFFPRMNTIEKIIEDIKLSAKQEFIMPVLSCDSGINLIIPILKPRLAKFDSKTVEVIKTEAIPTSLAE